MGGWVLAGERGSAATFHARPVPSPAARTVTVVEVDRPALVLGSTQPEGVADRAAVALAGAELVRRASGGSAVLLEPGGPLWVDVVVPRDDPLWMDDVSRAFHWLGRAWAGALTSLGAVADVHEGPLRHSRWSPLVCFAGLGPGEVTIGGAKVVGVAQRRTRDGARFQCALLRHWDPAPILALLALDPEERARAAAELEGVAAGFDASPATLVEAFVAHLPP